MSVDPIADALTRIRNAYKAKKDAVDIKASKLLEKVCDILKREGFIDNYKKIEDNSQGTIKVYLRYHKGGKPALSHIQRVSKPGRRRYSSRKDIPVVLQGFGIAVLSTSRGILTDREARELGVGGEIICEVY